jgi:hypothetical protein
MDATMTLKQKLRIALEIAMTALLLCAYNSQLARETTHIFIGVVTFCLFAIHIFINRNWFKTIFKGKYAPRRTVMTAINILLLLAVTTLMITGILETRWRAYFLQFEREITLRQLHTTTAYWFWPLIGVHLGFHWGMYRRGTSAFGLGGRFTKFIGKNNLIITVMRILACLFIAFGVWSFFDRDMFSKLFHGFSFDYWPTERPIILFFVQTLSIIGIFVFATYYFLKLFSWLKNKKIKNTNGGFL